MNISRDMKIFTNTHKTQGNLYECCIVQWNRFCNVYFDVMLVHDKSLLIRSKTLFTDKNKTDQNTSWKVSWRFYFFISVRRIIQIQWKKLHLKSSTENFKVRTLFTKWAFSPNLQDDVCLFFFLLFILWYPTLVHESEGFTLPFPNQALGIPGGGGANRIPSPSLTVSIKGRVPRQFALNKNINAKINKKSSNNPKHSHKIFFEFLQASNMCWKFILYKKSLADKLC